MAFKTCEKTGFTYSVTLEIPGDVFSAAIDKAYNAAKKNISIPGFRKGKVPKSVVEKYYGENVFYEDALDKCFPEIYEEALKDITDKVVSGPYEAAFPKMDKTGVEMTFKFDVKPEITVEGYMGLEAVKAEAKQVSDEDIDREIERLREQASSLEEVEGRAAENGDTANIDFEGFKDGTPFDGGKGEGYDLVLGSGQFIPGFEEQVVGHNAGDEFDIDVTFPENYGAEELAGAPVVFKIKLNSLSKKVLPEVDDDFAKDVSESANTLDELKEEIKKNLQENNDASAKREFKNNVLTALSELVKDEIPEAMVDTNVDEQLREFEQQLAYQGITLDQYAQYVGGSLDNLKLSIRPSAIASVKTDLALEKIAAIEGIEVSDEDVEAQFKKYADMYGMAIDEIKKAVPAESVKEDLIKAKTADFVAENAVPVDAPEHDDDCDCDECHHDDAE